MRRARVAVWLAVVLAGVACIWRATHSAADAEDCDAHDDSCAVGCP